MDFFNVLSATVNCLLNQIFNFLQLFHGFLLFLSIPSADYPSTTFRTYGANADYSRLLKYLIHPIILFIPAFCPLPQIFSRPLSTDLGPLSFPSNHSSIFTPLNPFLYLFNWGLNPSILQFFSLSIPITFPGFPRLNRQSFYPQNIFVTEYPIYP